MRDHRKHHQERTEQLERGVKENRVRLPKNLGKDAREILESVASESDDLANGYITQSTMRAFKKLNNALPKSLEVEDE